MISITRSLRQALSAYGGRLGMRRLSLGLLILALALGAAPALAVDIHVDNDCSLSNAIWSAMGRFQRGRNKGCETGSGNNDTIIISGTLWNGRKPPQLRGNMTIKGTNDGGIRAFGSHRGPILHVSLGNVTIKDLKLSDNSNNQNGGGALRQTGGNTTLDNVTISDNWAADGGGIAVYRGTVTLRNSTDIASNSANRGAGVFVGKNGRLNIAEITSTNSSASSIASNTASQAGGGIYAEGRVNIYGNATGSTARNAVRSNSAPDAAGIYTNATLLIDKANVSSNTATATNQDTGELRGYGGGITAVSNDFFPNANVTLRNGASISNNSAGYGGGVVLHMASLSGSDSIISGNTAAQLGADMFLQHRSPFSFRNMNVPFENIYFYNS